MSKQSWYCTHCDKKHRSKDCPLAVARRKVDAKDRWRRRRLAAKVFEETKLTEFKPTKIPKANYDPPWFGGAKWKDKP